MRELMVDMFSTVDGHGGGGPESAPYWGAGLTKAFENGHVDDIARASD